MSTFRAAWALLASSLRRQILSRRVILTLVIIALVGLAILVLGSRRPLDFVVFGRIVVVRIFGLFVLPAIAVAFGASVIGEERDEKTLVYTLARPIPRSLVFVVKLLAAAPVALALSLGSVTLFTVLAASRSDLVLTEALAAFLPAATLATLAYLAFFALLGVAFRHAAMIGAAYAFFVEVFVGRMPGVVKRISISFYHASKVYDAGSAEGLKPFKRSVFLPVTGETATWVLAAIALACLVLGAWLFAVKEQRDTV